MPLIDVEVIPGQQSMLRHRQLLADWLHTLPGQLALEQVVYDGIGAPAGLDADQWAAYVERCQAKVQAALGPTGVLCDIRRGAMATMVGTAVAPGHNEVWRVDAVVRGMALLLTRDAMDEGYPAGVVWHCAPGPGGAPPDVLAIELGLATEDDPEGLPHFVPRRASMRSRYDEPFDDSVLCLVDRIDATIGTDLRIEHSTAPDGTVIFVTN